MKTRTYICRKCKHRETYGSIVHFAACPDCHSIGSVYCKDDKGQEALEYRSAPRAVLSGDSYIVFRRKRIKNGPRPRAIWQRPKKGELYLTCPACRTIIDASEEIVDIRRGFITGCIVCPDEEECGTHFWAYLEGWKKP